MSDMTRLLPAVLLLSLTACPRSADAPPSPLEGGARTASAACGDATGAWSAPVSGLRARLVSSGSKPDRSALDIALEIENVSGEAVDLSWSGAIPTGFTRFRLDDAQGNDLEPDWRFGGNEPTGDTRALFPAKKTIRYDIHKGAFTMMMGRRALRIGAFWGRELPSDGSKRLLRATIAASASRVAASDFGYEGTELVRSPPPARAFTGTLEVPPLCIE